MSQRDYATKVGKPENGITRLVMSARVADFCHVADLAALSPYWRSLSEIHAAPKTAKAAHGRFFVPFAHPKQKRYLCRMPEEIPSIEQAKAAIAELKQQGLSIADIARAKGKSGRHSLQLESPDMRCYVVRLAKRYGWKP